MKFSAFEKYSVWEKQPLSFFKLQIILAATYIALFLRDSNNCFLYV